MLTEFHANVHWGGDVPSNCTPALHKSLSADCGNKVNLNSTSELVDYDISATTVEL